MNSMKKQNLLLHEELPQDPTGYVLSIRTNLTLPIVYYKRNSKAFFAVCFIIFLPLFLDFFLQLYGLLTNTSLNTIFNDAGSIEISIFNNSWNVSNLDIIHDLLEFLAIAFTGSAYGLAYDILSGGDEFAESKGFIQYFKRYWWKFLVISFISMLISQIYNILYIYIFEWIASLQSSIILTFFYYFIASWLDWGVNFLQLFILFGIFPSVIAQGKLSQAFKENFHLIRIRLKQVVVNIIIPFFIFVIIFHIIIWIYVIFAWVGTFPENSQWFFLILDMIQLIIFNFVGIPYYTLNRTLLYNSIYPPLGETRTQSIP
jgi:hypothetical protein